MPQTTQASGDSRLDRRFDFARAALNRGDASGAADVLEQTLAIMPEWAAAWQLLGYAREASSAGTEAAIAAHAEAHRHDSTGKLGATLDLARLGVMAAESLQPAPYVTALFDEYAPSFDTHLRFGLTYRGPELMLDAVLRAGAKLGSPHLFTKAYDLGCGTGLAAEVFGPHCMAFTGVDLSSRMISQARAKQLYARLVVGDCAAALAAENAASQNLILAADVFVYMGDLAPVFAASANALAAGGLLAFTAQTMEQSGLLDTRQGMAIGADKRFHHSRAYLESAMALAGLVPVLIDEASARKEDLKPVPGLVIVATLAAKPHL